MDINKAKEELLRKRVIFKNGYTDITIKKVDEILPPEKYDDKTIGHLYVVKGEIEDRNLIEGIITKIYVYPYTEIFVKIAGDVEKHT